MKRSLLLLPWILGACSDPPVEAALPDAPLADSMADCPTDTPSAPCQEDADCSDGVFCNGAEVCADGACLPAADPDPCDDSVDCTDDRCFESSGSCAWYSDHDACAAGEVCAAGGCAQTLPDPGAAPIAPERIVTHATTGLPVVQGECLLLGTPDLTAEAAAALLAEQPFEARIVGRLTAIPGFQVYLPGATGEELDLRVATLRELPPVAGAWVHTAAISAQQMPPVGSDTEYVIDGAYFSAWHLAELDVATAWDRVTHNPTDIVGVVDYGFDVTHPDLAPNIDGCAFNADGCDPAAMAPATDDPDVVHHGTTVAGLIAAEGASTHGAAGDAVGVLWGARLRLARSSTDLFSVLSAVETLAAEGARVIHVSLGHEWYDDEGGLLYPEIGAPKLSNEAFAEVFDQHRELFGAVVEAYADTLFVQAAGNEGEFGAFDYASLLMCSLIGGELRERVLCVGASQLGGKIAGYSNLSNGDWLAAPGGAPDAPLNGLALGGGMLEEGVYGTSYAAALVSGAAALALAVAPELGAAELKEALFAGANDELTGYASQYNRILDVRGAIERAQGCLLERWDAAASMCLCGCGDKQCGDNGCFGSCGACGDCQSCQDGACALYLCASKECGTDPCGNSCGDCPYVKGYCNSDDKCDCTKRCSYRSCGSDGCSGSCGACAEGDLCVESMGQCVPGGGGECVDASDDPLDGCVEGLVAELRVDPTPAPDDKETYEAMAFAGFDDEPNPAVATLADGRWVVAWSGPFVTAPGLVQQRIRLRLFGTDGAPETGELHGSPEPGALLQSYPQLARTGMAGFVVTYQTCPAENATEEADCDAWARRHDPAGSVTGDPVPLHVISAGNQRMSTVAGFDDGSFTAAWTGPKAGADLNGLYVRRFDADDAPLSSVETLIDSESTFGYLRVELQPLSGARTALAWEGDTSDGKEDVLFAVLGADGQLEGAPARVNVDVGGRQTAPTLTASADGAALVAWVSEPKWDSDPFVLARRVGVDSVPFGAVIPIAVEAGHVPAYGPRLVTLAGGGRVAQWQQAVGENHGDLLMRRLDSDAAPLPDVGHTAVFGDSTEGVESDYMSPWYTARHGLAAFDAGGFVAVWQARFNPQAPSTYHAYTWGVFARRFRADTTPCAVGTCGTGCGAGCDDNDPCTIDQCGASGCVFTPAPAGAPCGDGLGVCAAGACVCTPSCEGKVCGADGCGGSCGECATPLQCTAVGTCGACADGNAVDWDGCTAGDPSEVQVAPESGALPPAVAALKGGGFVVAWRRYQEPAGLATLRYDYAGAPLGTSYVFEDAGDLSYSVSHKTPSVAALADGRFAVAVQRIYGGVNATAEPDVVVLTFNAAGVHESALPLTTYNKGEAPRIAAEPGGGARVVWLEWSPTDFHFAAWTRRVTALGAAGSDAVQMPFAPGTAGLGGATAVDVDVLADGRGAVAWVGCCAVTNPVYLQLLGAETGELLGEPLALGTGHYAPAVDVATWGQALAVVWRPKGSEPPAATAVMARWLSAPPAAPLAFSGPEVALAGSGGAFEAAFQSSGDLLVVWESGEELDTDIEVGRFDTQGAPVSPPLQANLLAEGAQTDPAIGAFADGGFVAAWLSKLPGGAPSTVMVRRFTADGGDCLPGECGTACTPDCAGKACGDNTCGGLCGQCAEGEVCLDGQCACVPLCAGQDCGDDGCGGSCGECAPHEQCAAGLCQCVPQCDGKACGPDGCLGSCGACVAPTQCLEGACVCVPECDGKACGPDLCGGDCGTCDAGLVCTDEGQCECAPACEGKECGDDGCGGSCGECPGALGCVDSQCECVPDCAGKECGDSGCGFPCGQCPPSLSCKCGECVCVPSCAGKECGDDGCGEAAACGTCAQDEVCQIGACVACAPDCAGKECGDDGCGGVCGACSPALVCLAGVCAAVPDCTGKECGDDGVGGSCGECADAEVCDGGVCAACAADCAGKVCGDDGCGDSAACGVCPPSLTCVAGVVCACIPSCGDAACGDDGCGGSCGACPPEALCVDGGCEVSLVVNTVEDTDDGTCSAAHCSLREALAAAATWPGPDTIRFDIKAPAPYVVALGTPLPTVQGPVVIDGTTEPDYPGIPVVVLDGSALAAGSGLALTGPDVTVRGLAIGGFPEDGVHVSDASATVVEACHLGTDWTGLIGAPNGQAGVRVADSSGVGLTGNVIAGNGGAGVRAAGATALVVSGNTIGATSQADEPLGNAGPGLWLSACPGAMVSGNLVAANGEQGVRLSGDAAGAVLEANTVGTNLQGALGLGNTGDGVALTEGATGVRVGGLTTDVINVIAYNTGAGVAVYGESQDIAVLGNVIDGNAGLPIDLGGDGLTPNDAGDGDEGPNQLQNFPELQSVVTGAGSTSVQGALDAPVGTTLRIELYASSLCSKSEHGGLQLLAGDVNTVAGADGVASFEATLSPAVPVGWSVLATATPFVKAAASTEFQGTSEPSACEQAVAPAPCSCPFGVPCVDGDCVPGPACDDGNSTPWDGCYKGEPSEQIINEQEQGWQTLPAAAALPDGGFLVAWTTSALVYKYEDVRLRRFDHLGQPTGPEQQVDAADAADSRQPAMGVLSSGAALVAWAGTGPGDDSDIFVRRYDADTQPTMEPLLLNTTTTGAQSSADVAVLHDDTLFVAWMGKQAGKNKTGFYGQRLAADGALMGGEVTLQAPTSYIFSFDAEPLAGGGFYLAWRDKVPDVTQNFILGASYSSAGVQTTDPVQINTEEASCTSPVAAWLGNDRLAVVWYDIMYSDYGNMEVVGQLMGLDGTKLGPEHLVNAYTAGDQSTPSLSALPDGGYIAAWQGRGPGDESDMGGIFVQRYDHDATPVGANFGANVYKAYNQAIPATAALANGGVLLVWKGYGQDEHGDAILARRYLSDGVPCNRGTCSTAGPPTCATPCTDEDPCTANYCGGSGCTATPAPDGWPCGADATCQAGKCEATP